MAMRYQYYHSSVQEFFSWTIPSNQRVLVIGRDGDEDLDVFSPSRGVVVLPEKELVKEVKYEWHPYFNLDQIQEKFDYVIMKDVIGMIPDLGSFLTALRKLCEPHTRIVVYCHNYIWRPLLLLTERMKMKRSGGLEHLMSAVDIENVMTVAGFQLVSQRRMMLFPLFALGLGPLINLVGKLIPLFDWAKLNQFQIFRPLPKHSKDEDTSLTICLTCRDEKENIERLVKAIPEITRNQEILFIEGHSVDGTQHEIRRLMEKYPEKNIRLMSQTGIGQGNAIKEGFSAAKGDIIILLEADMTSPPENITFVFESIKEGYADFIEGSRFVYKMPKNAMPLFNRIGNVFFARFFSWLFKQKITDVLSGIKAIKKKDFDKLEKGWNSWGIIDPFGDFELLFGAIRLGLKTAWQPIHYNPRQYGKSKTRVIKQGIVLTKMAFKAFLKFRG